MGLHDIPAKGVVQLLEWELSINDKAHELLVAVLLLLGCWNVRGNRELSCLVLLGGPTCSLTRFLLLHHLLFRLSRPCAPPIMLLD
jgi:hypothetical protein